MCEVERIVSLVRTITDKNRINLQMRFAFETKSECENFFGEISHPQAYSYNELIWPQLIDEMHMAGVKLIVELEEKSLSEVCQSFRNIAAKYNGVPLKWLVRINCSGK